MRTRSATYPDRRTAQWATQQVVTVPDEFENHDDALQDWLTELAIRLRRQ
ncbi:hypothetical protein ACFYXH_01390 [Streptomyces sp. NPDC002730]